MSLNSRVNRLRDVDILFSLSSSTLALRGPTAREHRGKAAAVPMEVRRLRLEARAREEANAAAKAASQAKGNADEDEDDDQAGKVRFPAGGDPVGEFFRC